MEPTRKQLFNIFTYKQANTEAIKVPKTLFEASKGATEKGPANTNTQ